MNFPRSESIGSSCSTGPAAGSRRGQWIPPVSSLVFFVLPALSPDHPRGVQGHRYLIIKLLGPGPIDQEVAHPRREMPPQESVDSVREFAPVTMACQRRH